MRVLVTGGAGFIGSNTVRLLVDKGFKVYVVDTLQTGSKANLADVLDRVKFIQVSASEVLSTAPRGVDAILHLGIPSSSPMYRQYPFYTSIAVKDAIAVYEYARRHGAKVVIASTSSIYNRLPLPWREDMHPIPTDFYTEARLAIERIGKVYSELHGVKVVALRYFSVYGPREEYKGRYANVLTQMIWAGLRKEPFVVYGDGSQTRDFVFVGDVAEANLRAVEFLESNESRFEVFNVGSGIAYSFNEVADLLRGMGLDLELRYVETPIKNYILHTLADTRKAEKLLKWRAKTSLKDGTRKTLEYYKRLFLRG